MLRYAKNYTLVYLLPLSITIININSSNITSLINIDSQKNDIVQQELSHGILSDTLHSLENSDKNLSIPQEEFKKYLSNIVAIKNDSRKKQQKNHGIPKSKKDWTFFVYIAADNDLRGFAARNLQQMAAIGSTLHINIVAHLDTRISNKQKITRRYYIEKDKITHMNNNDPATQSMDSGSAQTLISFCTWGIKNFPANHYALVLWNHGSGIVDPAHGRIVNPSSLFTFNPITNKFELDRSIGFLDFISSLDKQFNERGICWDDSTGNYLNNQSLNTALSQICSSSLNGNKFDIIGFDACLMSMLEVADIAKQHAHTMIASQELELGPGWRYDSILHPFKNTTLSPVAFAQHIVKTYGDNYNKITDDYTLSAINLDSLSALEDNLSSVSSLLLQALGMQKEMSVKNAIRASRNKLLCTHFDEPSYLDLHHLYVNLQSNLKHFSFHNQQQGTILLQSLNQLLERGRSLIKQIVIANVVGANLRQASGISIYFPEHKIHSSYRKTIFANTNNWIELISAYLA